MNPDAELLALLRAIPNLNVYDGSVPVDETKKVISVPLPYIVFWSSPGYDNDERHDGRVAGRVVEFQLTGVGGTREQAKWVLEKARSNISRKRLGKGLIRRSDDNQTVRRDDDYNRPGNLPLFYGVERYAVAV
jgi:hypothetical protein